MKVTGASIIVKALLKEKTEYIFGYPGGSVIPLFDELYNYTDKIKLVQPRHEQGGAHAADGYARSTGKTGVVVVTSGPGAGPVEALDKALRKVLEKFYPSLKKVKLIDYKVRILNEQAATKATTRVLIQSTDGKDKWGTVGVSDNIIEASWIALTDAFKYKLMKDDEKKGGKNENKKN